MLKDIPALDYFLLSAQRYLPIFDPPLFADGIVVWRLAAQTHLENILILQKCVLRLIHFIPHVAHTVPLFAQASIIPVNMLYFTTASAIMHDHVSNNLTPPNNSTPFS